jgi:hypothetical protein
MGLCKKLSEPYNKGCHKGTLRIAAGEEASKATHCPIPANELLGSNPDDSIRFLTHMRRAAGDRTYGGLVGAELLALSVMEARE